MTDHRKKPQRGGTFGSHAAATELEILRFAHYKDAAPLGLKHSPSRLIQRQWGWGEGAFNRMGRFTALHPGRGLYFERAATTFGRALIPFDRGTVRCQ